jgi:hypothetical protein
MLIVVTVKLFMLHLLLKTDREPLCMNVPFRPSHTFVITKPRIACHESLMREMVWGPFFHEFNFVRKFQVDWSLQKIFRLSLGCSCCCAPICFRIFLTIIIIMSRFSRLGIVQFAQWYEKGQSYLASNQTNVHIFLTENWMKNSKA